MLTYTDIMGIGAYMPKSQDYYQGFDDGYKVAMQEIKDFVDKMGTDNNCFTGTICVKDALKGQDEWKCPHCGKDEGTWFDRTCDAYGEGMATRCNACGKDIDALKGEA